MRRTTLVMTLGLLALGCEGGGSRESAADMAMPQEATGSAANRAPARDGGGGIGGVGSGGDARGSAGSRYAKTQAVSLEEAQQAPPPAPAPASPPGGPRQADVRAGSQGTESIAPAMIIRTGNATLEVQQLDPAVARVRVLAQQMGGFVANSSMQGGRDQVRSATLELKIPAQRFDAAITGLDPVGKVEAVNVSAEDVGEEFVDVSARVANAKRLEDRLVRLLATQTGRLQDVLSVERELARIREEIERYEGRIRYLQTRVAVSTLVVNLHEPFPIIAGAPGQNPIVDAFRQAWRNFVGFVAWAIAASGILVPLLLLLVLAWLAWHRWGPRIERRPRPPAEPRPSTGD